MKQTIKMLASVILGNTLLAFAICAFVVPNGIMLGGANGIALFIQQFIPGVRLSVITAVVNVCLFGLGWAFLGWKFAATSLMSTIIYPLILGVFETLPIDTMFNENIVLTALAASVLCGLGIGIVVRSGGSTGGMDIPPCILYKLFGIPVGRSIMFFDTLVVLMQVMVKGLDGILCSILVICVISFVVDKTVVTGEKTLQMIIISPQYQQIREMILTKANCGVTLLDIETGYEGKPQKAILSVIYSNKYPEIRDAALSIDHRAFIITSDVTNVNGVGYTIDRASIKHPVK